jgi:transposase-like protein
MPRKRTKITEERDIHRTNMAEWETRSGILKLRGWASNGLSYKDIAQKMGITEPTLIKWRHKSEIIQEACTWGRDRADLFVESALFKRATGYSYEEVQTTQDSKRRVLERKITKKEVPASTTAAIFWLCNRKPKEWKNQKYEHTDNQESLNKLDAVLKRIDGECKKDTDEGEGGKNDGTTSATPKTELETHDR